MGRTGRVLVKPAAHKKFESNFYLQWPGEQVGTGLSAKEAVDAAQVISNATTANRNIFLINLSPWGEKSYGIEYALNLGQITAEMSACSKIERFSRSQYPSINKECSVSSAWRPH
jgi:hypothetical protein